MVDLSTALAAAAASDKRRGSRDGDKKRPGGKVGTEPFDPADHVIKEKADAASMWLVICYASLVAFVMRFVIMPAMDGPGNVLWSLPLLLILTIPTAHRVLLKKYEDRYTFGNWFRATFLYSFTWLALCLVLVNPPLADISPPEVAQNTVLIDLDSNSTWNHPVGEFSENDNLTQRQLGLAFAIRDNFDASDVNVSVVISTTGVNSLASYNGSADSMRGEWDLYSSHVSNVMGRSTDVPILIALDGFTIVENQPYTITITLTQNGNPWDMEQVYTHRLIVIT